MRACAPLSLPNSNGYRSQCAQGDSAYSAYEVWIVNHDSLVTVPVTSWTHRCVFGIMFWVWWVLHTFTLIVVVQDQKIKLCQLSSNRTTVRVWCCTDVCVIPVIENKILYCLDSRRLILLMTRPDSMTDSKTIMLITDILFSNRLEDDLIISSRNKYYSRVLLPLLLKKST